MLAVQYKRPLTYDKTFFNFQIELFLFYHSCHFSTLINDFKPGIFGALNEKKEELLKEGRKVYNLSVGTPDFEPPLHVMKAMEEACKDPNNYKYSLADMPELLEAVQYRYEKRFGVHVEKDEIMSVYGSQEAMAHIEIGRAHV